MVTKLLPILYSFHQFRANKETCFSLTLRTQNEYKNIYKRNKNILIKKKKSWEDLFHEVPQSRSLLLKKEFNKFNNVCGEVPLP